MIKFAAVIAAGMLLFISESTRSTDFSLPMDEDFEGFTSTSEMTTGAGCFIGSSSEDCSHFQNSNNGSSNEYILDTSDAYEGTKSLKLILDNINDSGAYRIEGQTHPDNNGQTLYNDDTYWIGFAYKIGVDNPESSDTNWFTTILQLKALDAGLSNDICNIYIAAIKNDTGTYAINNEDYHCGGDGGGDIVDSGVTLTQGQWHYIVLRADTGSSGDGVKVWINQATMGTPDLDGYAGDLFGGIGSNGLYLKLGAYKAWFRSDIHPEDRVFAEWEYSYDNVRMCEEGSGSCNTQANAFAWVNPGTGGAPTVSAPSAVANIAVALSYGDEPPDPDAFWIPSFLRDIWEMAGDCC